MFKKIQRNIDQKFLLSLDENIWVDKINECNVFNINELKSLFIKSGYNQIHQSINYYPFHNFDNYEQPHSSARHMNLIFSLPQ